MGWAGGELFHCRISQIHGEESSSPATSCDDSIGAFNLGIPVPGGARTVEGFSLYLRLAGCVQTSA